MAVKVKKAVLWKRDLQNRPGTLAESLKPFADSKSNLQVVMGYAYPGDRTRSALEIYPVESAKATEAARSVGLEPMTHTECLLVEGDDKVGLGYQMSKELADAGVNISFAIIQVVGGKFLAIMGFESAADADKAVPILKKVGGAAKVVKGKKAAKKAAARKPAKKGAARKKAAARKGGAKKPAAKKKAAKRPAAKKSTRAKAKKPAARQKAGGRK